jgi:hypothetical protein
VFLPYPMPVVLGWYFQSLLEKNRVIRYVLPSLLPTVVPFSCYCYPLSFLCSHPTSNTLFPVLSKQRVLVLSFEYLTDSSNVLPMFLILSFSLTKRI